MFIDIKFATSNANNITALNSIRNTRYIEIRKSIVSKLVRSITKRRRAKTNAKKKNLEIIQARNIEQFYSENNKKLLNNIDNNNSIDSLSLLVDS